MKIIYRSEFTSRDGYTQRVDIYDRDATVDTYTPFKMGNSPTRTFRSKSVGELFIQWDSQTVNIDWIAETLLEYNFFIDMLDADEQRYHMRWYYEDPAFPGFIEKFRGYLILDQGSLPDKNTLPFPFRITASDRIGLANNYDYTAVNGAILTGNELYKDHLIKCLLAMGIGDLYDSGDNFLGVTVRFYESRMATINTDPMALSGVNHRAFASKEEEQFEEVVFIEPTGYTVSRGLQPSVPGKCGDVIEKIAFAWGGKLYQQYGYYHFVQNKLIAGTGQQHHIYNKAGTQLSIGSAINNREILSEGSFSGSSETAKFSGGAWTFIPPLRLLRIDHLIGSKNNLITGTTWDIYDNPNVEYRELDHNGIEKVVGNFVFGFRTMRNTATIFENIFHRYKWGIKIKIGANYIKRPAQLAQGTVEYGDTTWETSLSYVEMYSDIVSAINGFVFLGPGLTVTAEFETEQGPPSGGLLEVEVVLLDIVGINGVYNSMTDSYDDVSLSYSGDNLSGTKYKLWWECRESVLKLIGDQDVNNDARTFIRYEMTADVNNSRTADYETKLGDDPKSNSPHRMLLWDGANWLDAEGWTYGTTGDPKTFVQILIEYMMSLRETRRWKLNGEIMSKKYPLESDVRIVYDNKGYILEQVVSDEQKCYYRGTWIEIRDGDKSGFILKSTRYNGAKDAGDPTRGSYVSPAELNARKEPEKADIITGNTTDRIPITAGTLPDTDLGEVEIRRRFKQAMKGTANMLYKETLSHPSHFGIDNDTNEIILFRASNASDEFTFVWS